MTTVPLFPFVAGINAHKSAVVCGGLGDPKYEAKKTKEADSAFDPQNS